MSDTDAPPGRMISISVRILYEHNREDLNLEILAGFNGLDRNIRIARIQKPGLALAGSISINCTTNGSRSSVRRSCPIWKPWMPNWLIKGSNSSAQPMSPA
jgi:hypothetical protein